MISNPVSSHSSQKVLLAQFSLYVACMPIHFISFKPREYNNRESHNNKAFIRKGTHTHIVTITNKYCRSGNIREVLFFANFAKRLNFQI